MTPAAAQMFPLLPKQVDEAPMRACRDIAAACRRVCRRRWRAISPFDLRGFADARLPR